ncbi:hypothetical protein BX266_2453 [Streptomyces sp. TLI_171]|nr:hypothetical protein BX266_2453 [Streptomyces sp. TLI_171]
MLSANPGDPPISTPIGAPAGPIGPRPTPASTTSTAPARSAAASSRPGVDADGPGGNARTWLSRREGAGRRCGRT